MPDEDAVTPFPEVRQQTGIEHFRLSIVIDDKNTCQNHCQNQKYRLALDKSRFRVLSKQT